MHTDTSE